MGNETCNKADDKQKIRLGIIGCGRIARRFIPEMHFVEGVSAEAVYNPHEGSAAVFARTFGIDKYGSDWGNFIRNVDAVYIASPHNTHFAYTRELLMSGKHVLCEKPLCFAKAEAEELYTLAADHGLILREAVKTAYCPGFQAIVGAALSGKIGEIRDVEAAFTRLTDSDTREYQDRQYGGSFTEFGSYALLPMLKLLGKDYREVRFQSLRVPGGVDEYTKAYFLYENGFATAKTGLGVKSEGQLLISGTKGYILAQSPWWLTGHFEVRYEDPDKREVYEYPFEGQGLRYEIQAFADAVRGEEPKTGDCGAAVEISDEMQKTEPTGLSAEESTAMAGIMEEFLRQSGR